MTAGTPLRYDTGEPPRPPGSVSERSRGVALGLAIVGGMFGLHRFYTGRVQSGVLMCLTLGGCGIWYLYDVVVLAAGDFSDGDGRRVVRWEVGEAASFGDESYGTAGATLVATAADVFGQSDVVLKVQPPSVEETRQCREGAALVALFQPSAERETVSQLAARRVTAFSLALLPRITRAQAMDVLSSQATVAGYKAVLLAAVATGRLFPMLVTAAGTLTPARVLVLGAGVAGLQAIATARRLGAVVSAFDVRPAVKEQVESLGAKFLEMQIGEHAETAGGYAKELSDETHRRELAFIAQQVKDADVVVTTAGIPGKRAPILITAEAGQGMRLGGGVVGLAVGAGGNCEVVQG